MSALHRTQGPPIAPGGMVAAVGGVFARVNVVGLAVAAALLIAWEVLVKTSVLDYDFLPAPSAIANHVPVLISETNFFTNVVHTLRVTLVGWVIASGIGLVVGSVIGLVRVVRTVVMASVDVLRALPAIALVPASLLVFGLSSKAELAVVVYAATWPVLVTTARGVTAVPPLLLDVGRTLKMSRLTFVRKIVLPGAIGPVLVGLRLSVTVSLVLAVVVEMVGNPVGLGHELVLQQQALQPELMFGYIFAIGLMAVLLNSGFLALIRLIWPGHLQQVEHR